MNVFTFTGNIGNDAEIRYTQSGDAIANFSVAVRAGYGKNENTYWANCALFGRRGEAMAPYLKKGQQVAVSGELNHRKWTNKEGMEKFSLDVNVASVTLLGKREATKDQEPELAKISTVEEMEDDLPF